MTAYEHDHDGEMDDPELTTSPLAEGCHWCVPHRLAAWRWMPYGTNVCAWCARLADLDALDRIAEERIAGWRVRETMDYEAEFWARMLAHEKRLLRRWMTERTTAKLLSPLNPLPSPPPTPEPPRDPHAPPSLMDEIIERRTTESTAAKRADLIGERPRGRENAATRIETFDDALDRFDQEK